VLSTLVATNFTTLAPPFRTSSQTSFEACAKFFDRAGAHPEPSFAFSREPHRGTNITVRVLSGEGKVTVIDMVTEDPMYVPAQ
jgi:hypothetical protein